MHLTWAIRIIEYLGIVAFAASGALMGIRKHMDPFGVAVLGLVTSTAGGAIRDMMLGITPPSMFITPIYSFIAITVSVIMFFPVVRKEIAHSQKRFDTVMFYLDTFGLAVFAVMGVRTVTERVPDSGLYLSLFAGFLSGCGGGILRDVLAGETPYIFSKHIYALAAIAGALLCALLWPLSELGAMIAGAAAVVIIRLLSSHFRWNLPQG